MNGTKRIPSASRLLGRLSSRERLADPLLWVAVTAPVFLDGTLPAERPAGLTLRWVQLAAVPLLAMAVAAGRRWPVVAAAVPAVLGLAATPELYTINFLIAQVVLAFLLGRRAPGMRPSMLLVAAVCAAGLVLAAFNPTSTRWSWWTILTTVVLTILLPALAGRYVRQRHELVRAGWELAGRLEREQDLAAEQARLRERSRIASDMHDSLGHQLTLIAVRAAALQVKPGLDDDARKAAAELRVTAAAATDRLQQIIGLLREDGQAAPVLPADDTITALVQCAAASGLPVALDGELPPLPPMADRAAYRVVQEALTNAAKHAPGAAITVRLYTDPAARAAVVEVTNSPPPGGPRPSPAFGGFGLVSLDERVRLAGGRLRTGPVGGGFAVTASLPLAAGATAAPPDSRRKFAQARRAARRSMLDAIWLPAAAVAVLAALVIGYGFYLAHRSLLDADLYQELRIGQSQTSVTQRLPSHEVEDGQPVGTPAEPPGTNECRYYGTTASPLDPTTVYRICFTDGQLSHKDRLMVNRD